MASLNWLHTYTICILVYPGAATYSLPLDFHNPRIMFSIYIDIIRVVEKICNIQFFYVYYTSEAKEWQCDGQLW